ncbi:ion transporter [Endozoicomonas acroporae]|uniref:ion transporter n=1 Tax=Endozoicomonas acroporae TaxID=1701104 RepID=UPI0013D01803|nr:ion transporter [Endozoicomonas acroporae]
MERVGPFQFFMLVLSIYVLLALCADVFFQLPAEVSEVLGLVDNIICLFFLFDFSLRFYQTENKRHFMKWGWIDLLSSIPMVDALRYGRLVRVVRLFRVLRAVRSTKVLAGWLFKKRMNGVFATVSSISVLLIIFGAISILIVEDPATSNIKTAQDAIWWAFVTITTVGYGDYYPVSLEGRLIAAVLMTAGVGLFGTFTGFVATWFLESSGSDQNQAAANDELELLREELAETRLQLMALTQAINRSEYKIVETQEVKEHTPSL